MYECVCIFVYMCNKMCVHICTCVYNCYYICVCVKDTLVCSYHKNNGNFIDKIFTVLVAIAFITAVPADAYTLMDIYLATYCEILKY